MSSESDSESVEWEEVIIPESGKMLYCSIFMINLI